MGAAASAGAYGLLADPLALAKDRPIGPQGRRRGSDRSDGGGGPALVGEGSFNQGVASGQPSERGITLWTRLDEVRGNARLELEVAKDADFAKVVHREQVIARKRRDFTLHARVSGKPLKPGQQYFYRFDTGEDSSPVGRFRTALPPDSNEPVRIGFFSCQDYESGFYTAHAGLADEADLDLVVCLGDYIYERSFDDNKRREDKTGANGDGEVMLLAEYRDKYNLYQSDPDLIRMRQSHPFIQIFDDHEVEDNWARDMPGEASSDVRIPFLARRRNGFRAFYEHLPRIRNAADRNRIFGRMRLGANADIFLLDTRSFRDDQPCGDMPGAPCPPEERNDPNRTLLGPDQKQWLLRGLERSRATWKVIGTQIMIMALDAPAGNPLNPDQWDGYGAERRELLEFVGSRGIQDVTFVTGDIHTFFAGNVTPDGREQRVGGEAAVATEFVGGSITSKGIADSLPTGVDLAAIVGDDVVVEQNNPHIKFSNQSRKGYGVLEARPDELLVSYRVPQTVMQQQSSISTLQSFRVERGSPDVQLV